MSGDRYYEIRDPIYGFITIDDWERDIINHEWFQRLRRIRQLAFTDMVYPGASHTRLEHSLGVMHLAGRAYEILTRNAKYVERLQSELGYRDEGIKRDRCLVRLAALLHDIGHGPFSHVSESLMRDDPEKLKIGKRGKDAKYTHEQYSAAIIKTFFKDVINGNQTNATNYGITADEVADLLEGRPSLGRKLFWRSFLSSQVDVDRMDYLLRDSYHAGVQYGHYDLDRLLNTMAITFTVPDKEVSRDNAELPPAASGGLTIGVEEGGWHAAEELILARYAMFTQVYFHKTRRAYDHHMEQVLKHVLKGHFPAPDNEKHLKEFLAWDDWRVEGLMATDKAGEHGSRIRKRNHYREVFHTTEVPSTSELDLLEKIKGALGDTVKLEDAADKSWYKYKKEEVVVDMEDGTRNVLSNICSVVNALIGVKQWRLYTDGSCAEETKKRVEKIVGQEGR